MAEEYGEPQKYFDSARKDILNALGNPNDHQGSRYQICYGLGGMLAKKAWPLADTAELIRAWLEQGADHIDIENGVRGARAAYELDDPQQARGYSELRELVPDCIKAIKSAVRDEVPSKYRDRADDDCERDEGESILGRLVDLSVPAPELKFFCRALQLAPGKISLLGGYAHSGKGPLVAELAICGATGASLFDVFDVQRGNVLILDYETGALAQKRIERICNAKGIDPKELKGKLFFMHADQSKITSAAWREELEAFIKANAIALVVLDSYTSAAFGAEHASKDAEYAALAAALGRVSAALDVVVVAVVHVNKLGAEGAPRLADIAGTNALAAMAQVVLALHRPDPNSVNTYEITMPRSLDGAFKPLIIEWVDVWADGRRRLSQVDRESPGLRCELASGDEPKRVPKHPGNARTQQEAQQAEAGARAKLLELLKWPAREACLLTEPRLFELAGLPAGRASRAALAALVAEGRFERSGSGKRGDPFKYSGVFSR
ncbi:MAG: AAA family ATPase [Polyangiaceae bacterium]